MSVEHWIQVVIYDQPGAPDDDELRDTVQNLGHVLEKQEGFEVGFWGRDPDDEAYATVTQWAGLEASEAGHQALAGMLSAAQTRGIRIVDRQSIQLFMPTPPIGAWFTGDPSGQDKDRPRRKKGEKKGLFRRHADRKERG